MTKTIDPIKMASQSENSTLRSQIILVFGYDHEHGVSVLLIKGKNAPFQKMWVLPGGLA